MAINPDCLQGYDFFNKFIGDYEKMESIGFDKNQILTMLTTQDYVQDFIETPDWLTSVKRLPKGYKWSDGTKYHKRGNVKEKSDSETYVFLSIDDDLYIKGLLDRAYESYVAKGIGEDGLQNGVIIEFRDKRICVIKDWKSKKDYKVNAWIGRTPFLANSLSNFWRDNGGNMSYLENN